MHFFNLKKYLLLIPTLVFVLGNIQLHDTYLFYMSWSDPQYCYLFNGLNIANGMGDIGHIDHPGTPVQFFSALIIKLTSVFRNVESLTQDVLRNPETYLFVISQSILFLVSFFLFLLGRIVFAKTQQILTALFFQTSTLFSFVISMYLPNLMTEPFIVMCSLAMLIFYIKYLFDVEGNEKMYAIIFGLLAGLTLSVKFSSFPVLVIPVFILTTWNKRIIYGLFSIISFIICTLPIFSKYTYFFRFIKGIFSHTGKYGTGDEQIINSSLYFENLQNIFSAGHTFSLVLLITLFTLLLIVLKKIKITQPQQKFYHLLSGIFIACIIQVIIVAKHYSYHYLIPVHIFSITSLYLVFVLTKKHFPVSLLSVLKNSAYHHVLFIIFFIFLIWKTFFIYGYFEDAYNPRRQTSDFLEKIKTKPRIIVADNTAAVPEPALHFGFVYSGEGKRKYASSLSQIFPNSYLYLLYDYKLRNFSQEFTFREIAVKHPMLYIYFSQPNDSIEKDVLNRFYKFNTQIESIKAELVFTNSINGEKIYLLHIDTIQLKNNIKTIRNIECNMEKVANDFFLSSDSLYTFKGAFLQSNEKAYTGKYAAKFTSESIFGLDIPLKVKAGRSYEISVQRNSPDKRGALIASLKNPSNFYMLSEIGEEKNSEWETLRLQFVIPENINDSTISIYLWNNGKGDVWFDDLFIKETEYR